MMDAHTAGPLLFNGLPSTSLRLFSIPVVSGIDCVSLCKLFEESMVSR